MPNRTATPTRSRTPRFSRTGTPARTGGLRGRRQPQRSGPEKLIGSVTSALGGGASSKSKSSSRGRGRGSKAGGAALLAGAAGMAFKNRNKLMSMFNRRGDDTREIERTNPTEAGTTPAMSATDPASSGNIAPTDPGNRPDML
jgi:hypothetical protein